MRLDDAGEYAIEEIKTLGGSSTKDFSRKFSSSDVALLDHGFGLTPYGFEYSARKCQRMCAAIRAGGREAQTQLRNGRFSSVGDPDLLPSLKFQLPRFIGRKTLCPISFTQVQQSSQSLFSW